MILFAYTLVEKLPGLETSQGGPDLTSYLSWLFKFMLAAAAFLAVAQIVIGGIEMIAGGASETARTDAKKRIQDALWGFGLALASWLILYTINPDLANMKLTIPEIKIEAIAPPAGRREVDLQKCQPQENGSCSNSNLTSAFGANAGNAAAICSCESSGQPDVKNPGSSAYGLFQITKATAEDFNCDYKRLNDTSYNIACAKKIYDKRGWQPWECASICGI